jgi:hypothetical protein
MPADHITVKVDDGKLLDGLTRLERFELLSELRGGMKVVAEFGARLVSRLVPRRTGDLAAGWKPTVTTHGGMFTTIEAAAELQPNVFYGRFQDTGWQSHPQGLHFIAKAEREVMPEAERIANELVKRAIQKAGF